MTCGNRLDRVTGADLSSKVERELKLAFRRFKAPPPPSAAAAHGGEEGGGKEGGSLRGLASAEFLAQVDTGLELPSDHETRPPAAGVSFADALAVEGEGGSAEPSPGEMGADGLAKPGGLKPGGLPPHRTPSPSDAADATAGAGGAGADDRKAPGAAAVGLAAFSAGGEAALAEGPSQQAGLEGGGADASKPTSKPERTALRVCGKFMLGVCDKSNCSLAHPGLRDSAEPFVSR